MTWVGLRHSGARIKLLPEGIRPVPHGDKYSRIQFKFAPPTQAAADHELPHFVNYIQSLMHGTNRTSPPKAGVFERDGVKFFIVPPPPGTTVSATTHMTCLYEPPHRAAAAAGGAAVTAHKQPALTPLGMAPPLGFEAPPPPKARRAEDDAKTQVLKKLGYDVSAPAMLAPTTMAAAIHWYRSAMAVQQVVIARRAGDETTAKIQQTLARCILGKPGLPPAGLGDFPGADFFRRDSAMLLGPDALLSDLETTWKQYAAQPLPADAPQEPTLVVGPHATTIEIADIRLVADHDMVKRLAHLYDASHGGSMDPALLPSAVCRALLRYRPLDYAIGSNAYRIKQRFLTLLRTRLMITHDCFATPVTTYFRKYFGFFPDIDGEFGGLVPFHCWQTPVEGQYLVFPPPAIPQLLELAASQVSRFCSSPSSPRMLFACIVPPHHAAWDHLPGFVCQFELDEDVFESCDDVPMPGSYMLKIFASYKIQSNAWADDWRAVHAEMAAGI